MNYYINTNTKLTMRTRLLFVLFLVAILFTACGEKNQQQKLTLTPYPNQLKLNKGYFEITSDTDLELDDQLDTASLRVINDFIGKLSMVSHFSIKPSKSESSRSSISFAVNDTLAAEAYNLKIDKKKVSVEANSPSGFYYAVQTMKQLLPLSIYSENAASSQDNRELPCVEIQDKPRFSYRGMHLDVSRHFFTKDEVKRYIDIMSVYKLNKFHWHLTDDQGWRIEIKKYPELTEVGSIRNKTMIKKEWDQYDTIPYGGYYTQDDIREIVKYAQDRFITVIPEIDIPGHMMAALAAYPELGCTGGPYEVSGQWGIRDDVLCVGKEKTFDFIEDVLSEVIDLFPSEYIHIGGDECPKVRWENCPACQAKINKLGIKSDKAHKAEHYLQSYAITRIEKFVNSKGRRIIGWDEILEGGLAPDATVMSWRGMEGGIEAARQKHDVIMTPSSHLYFDYYQSSDTENEPFSIGGCLPLERVYSFDPVPAELTSEEAKHIIGTQANLWTEYIPTKEQLEYQLLPRLAALAEVQWTLPASKDWSRFLDNLSHESQLYDLLGYNYAKHVYEIQAEYIVNDDPNTVEVVFKTLGNSPVYYTTDGTEPTEQSNQYKEPFSINKSCNLKAITVRDSKKSRVLSKVFKFNKATGNKVQFNQKPFPKYTYAGETILTDGLRGDFNYANGSWLGYNGTSLDVNLRFPEPVNVSSVKIGTLVQYSEYIFPPSQIIVYNIGQDGNSTKIGELNIPMAISGDKDGLYEYTCLFDPVEVNELKIVANPVDSIPSWHGAHGEKAFLFVDEIVVD